MAKRGPLEVPMRRGSPSDLQARFDLADKGAPPSDIAERFWRKVDMRTDEECWEWQAYRSGQNYGQFGLSPTRPRVAHRVAYSFATCKPIPVGLVVRHMCDNPPCCNPAHLELGTQAENFRDAMDRGRWNCRGEGNAVSKLTEEDVHSIRSARASGETGPAIAARYGVTKKVVYGIAKGSMWGHVPLRTASESGGAHG